jgi:hypothetical protein
VFVAPLVAVTLAPPKGVIEWVTVDYEESRVEPITGNRMTAVQQT